MAMGSALGADLALLAEVLPHVERHVIASFSDEPDISGFFEAEDTPDHELN